MKISKRLHFFMIVCVQTKSFYITLKNKTTTQHQLQGLLYEDQLGAGAHTPNFKNSIAKNDHCVPRRLRDQPKKNENNLKEC